jgi:lysozyme
LPKKVAAPVVACLRISGYEKGAEFIKLCEGCHLVPYDDGAGYPTIGWGNRYYKDGSEVRLDNRPLTQAEADDLFDYHYSRFWNRCRKGIPGWGQMHSGTQAALVSLAYNDNYQYKDGGHDTLDAAIDSGNETRIGQALLLYDKSNGKVMKGLSRRRHAEAMMAQDSRISPETTRRIAWAD